MSQKNELSEAELQKRRAEQEVLKRIPQESKEGIKKALGTRATFKEKVEAAKFGVGILPKNCPISPTEGRQVGITECDLLKPNGQEPEIDFLREGNTSLSRRLPTLPASRWGLDFHERAKNGGKPIIRLLKSKEHYPTILRLVESIDT